MLTTKQKDIALWQFAGFAAVSVAGTLLHFLYDWTDSTSAALFSGVNESTWEHMKLLFFPLLLFAVAESLFIGKQYENFWCIKLVGCSWGILLIPLLFYTLQGCFGKTPDWVNITIFFASAAVALSTETRLLWKGSKPCPAWKRRLVLLCLTAVAVAFWAFTFFPPHIPLFRDPVDGSYGI